MKLLSKVSLLLLVIISPIHRSSAQILTSAINGTVSREDGQPIPGTEVRRIHRGRTVSLVTDSEGHFSFHFVEPGRHVFSFEHPSVAEVGIF